MQEYPSLRMANETQQACFGMRDQSPWVRAAPSTDVAALSEFESPPCQFTPYRSSRVECSTDNREVEGANPSGRTISSCAAKTDQRVTNRSHRVLVVYRLNTPDFLSGELGSIPGRDANFRVAQQAVQRTLNPRGGPYSGRSRA